MKLSQLRQIIKEEIENTKNNIYIYHFKDKNGEGPESSGKVFASTPQEALNKIIERGISKNRIKRIALISNDGKKLIKFVYPLNHQLPIKKTNSKYKGAHNLNDLCDTFDLENEKQALDIINKIAKKFNLNIKDSSIKDALLDSIIIGLKDGDNPEEGWVGEEILGGNKNTYNIRKYAFSLLN